MKSYKSYEQISIGTSDIASLILVGCSISSDILKLYDLHFGGDGSYTAYLVNDEAEIGSHYEKVYECCDWLRIYDDNLCVATLKAPVIRVYRAGDFGCIIQLCKGYKKA